jgi:hypothetical protein
MFSLNNNDEDPDLIMTMFLMLDLSAFMDSIRLTMSLLADSTLSEAGEASTCIKRKRAT